MRNGKILILCEGPEDLAALRELLSRQWALVKLPALGAVDRGTEVHLRAVGGRSNLDKDWPKAIRQGSPSEPYVALGINFDPNGDDEPGWRRLLFTGAWGPTLAQGDDGSYEVPAAETPHVGAVPVVPLPWGYSSPCSAPRQTTLGNPIPTLGNPIPTLGNPIPTPTWGTQSPRLLIVISTLTA